MTARIIIHIKSIDSGPVHERITATARQLHTASDGANNRNRTLLMMKQITATAQQPHITSDGANNRKRMTAAHYL